MTLHTPWRDASFDRLAGEHFDLLVIGAGIIGSRIALDAAAAGLRVALVDRGDIGGATSSSSSKLLHGGFRYLKTGQVALVHDACRERARLLRSAPTLAQPLPLITVVKRGGPHARCALQAALMAYRTLSAGHGPAGRFVSPAAAAGVVPQLAAEGLRPSLVLDEAVTDDARLTLATAAAAARSGAVVATHAPVTGFEYCADAVCGAVVRDALEGFEYSCRATTVVNATGPWVDVVRRLDQPSAKPSVRFSKGVHCTLPLPAGWRAGIVVPLAKGYEVHALPWRGLLLAGTTDDPHDGPDAPVEAGPEEIARVLEGLGSALRPGTLDTSQVLAAYAGLRVLPRGDRATRQASREHIIDTAPSGLVSVAGGKLTTHRMISRAVLADLWPGASAHSAWHAPLPGASLPEPDDRTHEWLGTPLYTHLVSVYGDELGPLLDGMAVDGLDRVHPDGPDVWAQVDHAVRAEWAVTADDVLVRRTTLALRGLATPEVREAVAARIGSAHVVALAR